MELFNSGSDGDNFLDDLSADEGRDETSARAGEENAVLLRSETMVGLQACEEIEDFFCLFCVVAFIGLGNELAVR
jgi:hypothetical protein